MKIPTPRELVANALNTSVDDIPDNAGMYVTHGWDSLGHIDIILALENAYGVKINDATVEKYTTLQQIIELYEQLQGINEPSI